MSPKVSFKPYARTTPNWLGSRITDPKVVIPGGIFLDARRSLWLAAKPL
jgi:hypothetical protein